MSNHNMFVEQKEKYYVDTPRIWSYEKAMCLFLYSLQFEPVVAPKHLARC